MRVITLLALLFGFLMQLFLDGRVFTHAVFGIACGLAALGCGLASSKRQRQYRWEGWIMAGLGVVLLVWCVVALPSSYYQQQRFNNRGQQHREKMQTQKPMPD